jgi:uncharacterized protein (TIGR02246 family)
MQWFKKSMLAAALVVLPVMAIAQSPMDDKTDMQKLATQWMESYNKRDAAALAAAYASDALLSFTTWTGTGRAAIQEGFTKEFAAVDVKITAINVDQAQRLGDWEHSRGTWAAEMKAPDGKTMPMNGHWLIIGTCQGRTCLIGSHVANTDMPPPPQTSAK